MCAVRILPHMSLVIWRGPLGVRTCLWQLGEGHYTSFQAGLQVHMLFLMACHQLETNAAIDPHRIFHLSQSKLVKQAHNSLTLTFTNSFCLSRLVTPIWYNDYKAITSIGHEAFLPHPLTFLCLLNMFISNHIIRCLLSNHAVWNISSNPVTGGIPYNCIIRHIPSSCVVGCMPSNLVIGLYPQTVLLGMFLQTALSGAYLQIALSGMCLQTASLDWYLKIVSSVAYLQDHMPLRICFCPCIGKEDSPPLTKKGGRPLEGIMEERFKYNSNMKNDNKKNSDNIQKFLSTILHRRIKHQNQWIPSFSLPKNPQAIDPNFFCVAMIPSRLLPLPQVVLETIKPSLDRRT